ncbi:DNA-binding transcription factor [Sorochytrium milnesiophthora]
MMQVEPDTPTSPATPSGKYSANRDADAPSGRPQRGKPSPIVAKPARRGTGQRYYHQCATGSKKSPVVPAMVPNMGPLADFAQATVNGDEIIFSCNTCSKMFTRIYNLKSHLKTHLGDKPFACEECGKAFLRKSDMARHTKVHLKKKEVHCPRCKSTYARQESLTAHLEREPLCREYARRLQQDPLVIALPVSTVTAQSAIAAAAAAAAAATQGSLGSGPSSPSEIMSPPQPLLTMVSPGALSPPSQQLKLLNSATGLVCFAGGGTPLLSHTDATFYAADQALFLGSYIPPPTQAPDCPYLCSDSSPSLNSTAASYESMVSPTLHVIQGDVSSLYHQHHDTQRRKPSTDHDLDFLNTQMFSPLPLDFASPPLAFHLPAASGMPTLEVCQQPPPFHDMLDVLHLRLDGDTTDPALARCQELLATAGPTLDHGTAATSYTLDHHCPKQQSHAQTTPSPSSPLYWSMTPLESHHHYQAPAVSPIKADRKQQLDVFM